jgi:zinc transporter 9
LHLFVGFGAGIFLGTVFLHMLPALHEYGHTESDSAYYLLLAGFVGVLLLERVLLYRHSRHCHNGCEHTHRIVGITAFVGLAVHGFTDGLALGLTQQNNELVALIFLALLMHKATETFSLSTIFQLAGWERRKTGILILIFSLITPVAGLLALPFGYWFHALNPAIPMALATGTFLYVATCDLLPEAFSAKNNRFVVFAWLMLGIVVMALLHAGHAH